MIEHLRVSIRSEELKVHLNVRAAWHSNQAALIESDIPKIRESFQATSFKDDKSVVENRIKKATGFISYHSQKARTFRFVAAHLHNDSYSLSVEECASLELCPTLTSSQQNWLNEAIGGSLVSPEQSAYFQT